LVTARERRDAALGYDHSRESSIEAALRPADCALMNEAASRMTKF
jgi:hypothetical protein